MGQHTPIGDWRLQIADSRIGDGDWRFGLGIDDLIVDEFISKIGVAAEEADESKGWLELLVQSGKTTVASASALIHEADELTAIFVKSRITAERNKAERARLERQMKAPKPRRG